MVQRPVDFVGEFITQHKRIYELHADEVRASSLRCPSGDGEIANEFPLMPDEVFFIKRSGLPLQDELPRYT